MIRIISIASLMALLILVLYLPSANPPERFIEQLRVEHAQIAIFWNHQHSERILARTLAVQATATNIAPVPGPAPDRSVVGSAVGNEMSAVNARLFNSQYFRSIDALLLLASFRFFALLEWTHWLGVFCIAAIVDGSVSRVIKAKQFAQHDPEMFALYASAAIMLICGTVIAFVLPAMLPPILLPAVPICLAVLTAAALSNFHSR